MDVASYCRDVVAVKGNTISSAQTAIECLEPSAECDRSAGHGVHEAGDIKQHGKWASDAVKVDRRERRKG